MSEHSLPMRAVEIPEGHQYTINKVEEWRILWPDGEEDQFPIDQEDGEAEAREWRAKWSDDPVKMERRTVTRVVITPPWETVPDG